MDPLDTKVAIKAQDADTLTVAGWGVVFGGMDLQGTRFTSETDFWLDGKRLGKKKVVLYDHGFDDAVKRNVVGNATITIKDDGLWVEAQLEKASRYAQQIARLIEAGVLGWSSGAIAHLIDAQPADDGVPTFKSWPIVEMSLTPTPAEPRTLGVQQLRSLIDTTEAHAEALKSLLPEDGSPAQPLEGEPAEEPPGQEAEESPPPPAEGPPPEGAKATTAATADPAPGDEPGARISTRSLEEGPENMDITELASDVAGLKSGQETLNGLLTKLMGQLEAEPAIRKAGYYTVDGGTADPAVKSFGDFLLAIKRGDAKRLATVYGAVKDLAEGNGTTGGYLVPADHRKELLRLTHDASPILSLVTQVPVATDSGSYPALDQYIAPTAGSGATAMAAGITASSTAEGAALTETQATFKEILFRVTKRGGYTEVSNELIADSAESIEVLLKSLFAIAISSKRERDILRGSGVGEPLGILTAPCTIGVATITNEVFAYLDALGMMARHKVLNRNAVRWIMHQGVLPDLGGAGWVQGDFPQKIESLGYGSPILSEHMPQANGDDVILADLSAYLLFVRQELSIAFSEHASFTNDKGVWRFVERTDGKPWLSSAITLADPTGSYTVSPFVFHND